MTAHRFTTDAAVSSRKYTPEQFVAQFWRKVDKRGPDECWAWQAPLNRSGYGRAMVNRQPVQATHVALALDGRPRPGSLIALHSCDNRWCVNPAHLRWGTHKDNAQDRDERGRAGDVSGNKNGTKLHPETVPKGSRHWNAKLNDEAVRAIRASSAPASVFAREYKVSVATVNRARSGELWAHIGAYNA